MIDDNLIAVLALQGLALVTAVAAVRTRLAGVDKRTGQLETDAKELPSTYVPRLELKEIFKRIEDIASHTNSLIQALIYAGGDRSIAIKAIEAAAAIGDGASLDWIEPYLHTQLPRFEGSIPYLYLDTRDHVTIASGAMIPDAAAALRLPLRDRTGDHATPQAIIADFNRVARMPPGHIASFYRCPTSLIVSADDIADLRRTRCLAFVAQLREEFSGFDGFPVNARLALLDLIYDLGLGREPLGDIKGTGLLNFTHLCAAVRLRRWNTCGLESARDRDNPAFNVRNDWTRTQFLVAAQEPSICHA